MKTIYYFLEIDLIQFRKRHIILFVMFTAEYGRNTDDPEKLEKGNIDNPESSQSFSADTDPGLYDHLFEFKEYR